MVPGGVADRPVVRCRGRWTRVAGSFALTFRGTHVQPFRELSSRIASLALGVREDNSRSHARDPYPIGLPSRVFSRAITIPLPCSLRNSAFPCSQPWWSIPADGL